MVPWSNTARRVMPWPNATNRPNTSWRRGFSVATVRHPTAWGRQAPRWHCSLVSDSAAVLNCVLSTPDLCWMRNACPLVSQCGTCLTPRAYTFVSGLWGDDTPCGARDHPATKPPPHTSKPGLWVCHAMCDMRTSPCGACVYEAEGILPEARSRTARTLARVRCPSPATTGRKSFLSPGGGMCK